MVVTTSSLFIIPDPSLITPPSSLITPPPSPSPPHPPWTPPPPNQSPTSPYYPHSPYSTSSSYVTGITNYGKGCCCWSIWVRCCDGGSVTRTSWGIVGAGIGALTLDLRMRGRRAGFSWVIGGGFLIVWRVLLWCPGSSRWVTTRCSSACSIAPSRSSTGPGLNSYTSGSSRWCWSSMPLRPPWTRSPTQSMGRTGCSPNIRRYRTLRSINVRWSLWCWSGWLVRFCIRTCFRWSRLWTFTGRRLYGCPWRPHCPWDRFSTSTRCHWPHRVPSRWSPHALTDSSSSHSRRPDTWAQSPVYFL